MGERQRQAGPGCLIVLAVVLAFTGMYVLDLGYGGFQVLVLGLLFLVGAVVLVFQAWRQKGEQILNEDDARRSDRDDPGEPTED